MTSQCEELMDAIRRRHVQLLASIREQRTRKQQAFSDRLVDCTQRLHRTTGLIQFAVETLKEPDPSAFLLVCNFLRHFAGTVHFFSARRVPAYAHRGVLYTAYNGVAGIRCEDGQNYVKHFIAHKTTRNNTQGLCSRD